MTPKKNRRAMSDKIVEAQKFFQSQKGFVHLKRGGVDRVTSVLIPVGAVCVMSAMLAKGVMDLTTGSNKKEGF